MWIKRVAVFVGTVIGLFVGVVLVLITMDPKEAESNAAAWLDYVGLTTWGEGFTAATDGWINAILGVILVCCLSPAMIFYRRSIWAFFTRRKAPPPKNSLIPGDKDDDKEIDPDRPSGRATTPEPIEQQGNDRSILDDAEAVRLNPGNGWRAARLIMQCSTMDEIDAIFEDFKSAPHTTSSAEVFAARALKKNHLLNKDDQDEDWWWDFYEEANEMGISDGQALTMFEKLEAECPMDKDQAGDD